MFFLRRKNNLAHISFDQIPNKASKTTARQLETIYRMQRQVGMLISILNKF